MQYSDFQTHENKEILFLKTFLQLTNTFQKQKRNMQICTQLHEETEYM